MIAPEVVRTLRAIDWDFITPRQGYAGPPHWYPGTFPPALSDALIESLTPKNGTVFDPYGGIGTTGWSALRTGRAAQIADINPIASLVSYTSNALLALQRRQPGKAQLAIAELGRIAGRNDDLFGKSYGEAGSESDIDLIVSSLCEPDPHTFLSKLTVSDPNWEALQPWFDPSTLKDIQTLLRGIQDSDSAFVKLLGMSMISAIARSLSSQHASWGHIADNVKPRELKVQQVFAATGRWLKRTISFLKQPIALKIDEPDTKLLETWRRNWAEPGPSGPGTADLLLTSPPYADAIDYILSQRLSLYILGYTDPEIHLLVSNEIGARRKRTKSDSRSNWANQLCSALKEQTTWLRPNGLICLVLPHKDSGRSAGEEQIRVTLADLGWQPFFERDRSILQSQTRQSWTSIKQETIVAFSKGE